MHTLSGQIPQFPYIPRRHPTALQLVGLQQVGDPPRILGVGLVTVESLDMLWVHQQQLLEVAFEQVPDRAPILTGGLQRDLGNLAVLQPRSQFLQIARIGSKLPPARLAFPLPCRWEDADHDALLVYIDAATAAIRRFHRCFLSDHRAKDAWRWIRHSYACSSADWQRQQFQVPIECVLTKFTHGLLSAPTIDRPLDSL